MGENELGRITKVDLRDYWPREDTNFTPWLADEGNIDLLGDSIGIELEVQEQEASVGPFRADILCRNTVDGSLVLIENQLDRTDHAHLGQLLTYASGLDAVTLVWVVKSFSEEHRAAMDWLNRITDEKFHFFGIEVELWRIGTSPAAPKFNIVAKPNDWAKKVRETAEVARLPNTPWGQTQVKIWREFGAFIEKSGANFKSPKPYPSLWVGYGVGRTGAGLVVSFTKTSATVHVQLDNNTHPDWYPLVHSKKDDIEYQLGLKPIWEERPTLQFAVVKFQRTADMENEDCWQEVFEWWVENMDKMKSVFRPVIKELP